ncbi:unnamed protein product, partial [Aureobasidium pullulans]
MSLRAAPSTGFLQSFLAVASASLRPAGSARSFLPLGARSWPAPLLPSIVIPIPGLVSDIWESILKATSHMKKRHRQMAGKGLKDVTSLNKCSGCGRVKRAHYLCPHCVMRRDSDKLQASRSGSATTSSPRREKTEWEKKDQEKRMDQRKHKVDEIKAEESKIDETDIVDRK